MNDHDISPFQYQSLEALTDRAEFQRRHIGTDYGDDRQQMLATIGVNSVEELIDLTVPASIRNRSPLGLGDPVPESEVTRALQALAAMNAPRTSLIGMGYTGTITPPVIRRNMIENPAWYTSYTPYQAEISQGRLESLVNFQTLIADLTGLPIANASLLDEATAAAEAMVMARRASKSEMSAFFVDRDTHPQTVAVLRHRAEPLDITVCVGDPFDLDAAAVFGGLFSFPSSTGNLRDLRQPIATLHDHQAIAILAVDPLASVLLPSAGSWGADIAIGSAQRFGVPMGFGGPHAAFMATTEVLARTLPGRLVGVSTDERGRPAMRLALQTREQHIRREKATSNICTAQALLANVAAMYALWHGPDGLSRIAERVLRLTSMAAFGLRQAGFTLVHETWFDTITVSVPGQARDIAHRGRTRDLDFRFIDDDTLGLTFDETSNLNLLLKVLDAFGCDLAGDGSGVSGGDFAAFDQACINDRHPSTGLTMSGIPDPLRRTDPILTAEVFQRYRTEHEMLRYLRRLADKDLALDRTMIPLGSCTMKLNATTEMEPITWPGFANVHPYAPDDETAGYRSMIDDLCSMLAAITGYDAVSLQPNAGSQGEFAGLMAIRAYHRSRGDDQRTVCLIPSSAHGTNAASAVMAGMTVTVVGCDVAGNIDLGDLQAKIDAAGERLAAVMITYPSTHGVFETDITTLCDLVHRAGGQVYVDGANLNALVGLARPGSFGADVSHLNLHKTFCIPHGGGGPGVGPVAVKSHLADFLPTHPLHDAAPNCGPVSAAPFGSAGILPISWAYMKLMGEEGLRRASEMAIVHANYIARRIEHAFPVLYSGANGFVAHECIIDLRGLTKASGVTVDDVAKRLMDFGFHAPTMSFPVAGTLMIEPTESESKREMDRFCSAMLSIRAEIEAILDGHWSVQDSPLRQAPHTIADLADEWVRPYPRQSALPHLLAGGSYVTPVNRIDAAYGDRNLMCTCAPLEAYSGG